MHHHVPAARCTWAYFRSRCYSEGLSKAAVARLAGAGAGLSSERRYVTRTLPGGFGRGVADGLLGRRAGFARGAAILIGLAWTTAGYVVGVLQSPAVETGPDTATMAPPPVRPVCSPPRKFAA